MITTREPEWDEVDRAMVDVYLDHRADLHTCGRPLSESLKDTDKPDPDYQVVQEICLACMAYDKYQAEQTKADEPLREQGRHPDSYRVHTMRPLIELPLKVQRAILADRNRSNARPPTRT
jgi:hypothetical protein